MKHTKGPWSINEWTQPDREIGIGAVGTPLIAKVMLRDVSINEQKANAKLIALAPEMLAVLQSFDALIQGEGETDPNKQFNAYWNMKQLLKKINE